MTTPERPRTLLAACGLYCGACYHYRAGFDEGQHLLADEARGGRPLRGYTCRGCWSGHHYRHVDCQMCAIRACAEARGVPHCGFCEHFPCDRLRAFQSNGRKHHVPVIDDLRSALASGADGWLARQADRWSCPACGVPFSWYEATCANCGTILTSHAPDVPV